MGMGNSILTTGSGFLINITTVHAVQWVEGIEEADALSESSWGWVSRHHHDLMCDWGGRLQVDLIPTLRTFMVALLAKRNVISDTYVKAT